MNPKTFTAFFAAFLLLIASLAFSSEKDLNPMPSSPLLSEESVIRGETVEIRSFNVSREEATDIETSRKQMAIKAIDSTNAIYALETAGVDRLVVHLKPRNPSQEFMVFVAVDGKLHSAVSSSEAVMPRKYHVVAEWEKAGGGHFRLDAKNGGGEFVVFPDRLAKTEISNLYHPDQGIFIGVSHVIQCKCPFPKHHQPKAITEWFILKPLEKF